MTKKGAMQTLGDGPLADTPVTQPIGIAAIALQMALQFHDTTIIKDGAMYQQYKLEGKNIRPLMMDAVFETAIQIEKHLLASEDRIALLVAHVIDAALDDETITGPQPPEPPKFDPGTMVWIAKVGKAKKVQAVKRSGVEWSYTLDDEAGMDEGWLEYELELFNEEKHNGEA